MGRLGELAREESLLERLVAETNARLQRQAPALLKQRRGLQKSLDEVNGTADRLLTGWASLDDDSVSNAFISEKLNQLSRQRGDLESGIAEIDSALEAARKQAVNVTEVRQALANIAEVYACLQPFEQKELMQLILQGAEISERQMVLEIRSEAFISADEPQRREVGAKGKVRFEPTNWLPRQDSNLRPSG